MQIFSAQIFSSRTFKRSRTAKRLSIVLVSMAIASCTTSPTNPNTAENSATTGSAEQIVLAIGGEGDAAWAWLVNLDHTYFVDECLDIGEPQVEPHGHGWPITANISEWEWTCE